ncbi:putative MFS family arabinose efflux permease [Pseudorhizobium tarimense]|uniref:MFS family arabinose efflux permease n=1 Tax=Pseudorhizobium tarimense TaxID=1079109 RepID=A0ABV2H6F9_9HYPH|nr:MFS transporter [Pseudorhizobium tarimense]MCJ8519047.1 MFS transporter [Pseudorhizobium tarimense]
MTTSATNLPVDRLPLTSLLSLAMAGFITILTEALPAGVLSLMSLDLRTSEALIGQTVTVYALGSMLAAIPLTTATQGWRRRPLLLLAISGFAVANTITAITDSYAVLLGARFIAGICAGLVWALLAGYAARMVPSHLQGRAIAVAMVGTPLALALGIPAGTALGNQLGWRITFGLMSVMTIFLILWIVAKLPDFPGSVAERRASLRRVFTLQGVRTVLFMTLAFVLAHNVFYTYIAPFLHAGGMGERIDPVLLTFGAASLLGIWGVGALIDGHLRVLILTSFLMFTISAIGYGIWPDAPTSIFASTIVWGLSFGGSATLFQTASAKAAGESADVAQSMIVTVWNIGIAGGGIIGGLVLNHWGVTILPWTLVFMLSAGFAVALRK